MPQIPLKNVYLNMKNSYKSGSRIIQFIGGEQSIYPGIEKVIKLSLRIGYKIIQMVTNPKKNV